MSARPDWIDILAAECERASQARVAKRLGYSASTINQMLKGSYKGDRRKIEDAVRGAYMGAIVECPVLGPIARDVCVREQRKGLVGSHPMRVRLYRACRSGCQHSHVGGDDSLRATANHTPARRRGEKHAER